MAGVASADESLLEIGKVLLDIFKKNEELLTLARVSVLTLCVGTFDCLQTKTLVNVEEVLRGRVRWGEEMNPRAYRWIKQVLTDCSAPWGTPFIHSLCVTSEHAI